MARERGKPLSSEAPQPSVLLPAAACTLQTLRPEDKQKVASLLQQVVDLGQEVRTLKTEAKAQKETSQQLTQENANLKAKMAQMLTIMRAYQHKVAQLSGKLSVAQAPPAPLIQAAAATAQQASPIAPEQPAVPPSPSPEQAMHVHILEAAAPAPAPAVSSALAPSTDPSQPAPQAPAAAPGQSTQPPQAMSLAPGSHSHLSITIQHQWPNSVPPPPATASQASADHIQPPQQEEHSQLPASEPAGPIHTHDQSTSPSSPSLRPSSRGEGAASARAAPLSVRPQSSLALGAEAGVMQAGQSSFMQAQLSDVGSLGQHVQTPLPMHKQQGRSLVVGPRALALAAAHGEVAETVEVVAEGGHGDPPTVAPSPMLVAPMGEAAGVAALLLSWQAQQGLLPSAIDSSAPCVLRFDPSVGRAGAFYLADLQGPSPKGGAGWGRAGGGLPAGAMWEGMGVNLQGAEAWGGAGSLQGGEAWGGAAQLPAPSALPAPGPSRWLEVGAMERQLQANRAAVGECDLDDQLTESLSDLESELTLGSLGGTPATPARTPARLRALAGVPLVLEGAGGAQQNHIQASRGLQQHHAAQHAQVQQLAGGAGPLQHPSQVQAAEEHRHAHPQPAPQPLPGTPVLAMPASSNDSTSMLRPQSSFPAPGPPQLHRPPAAESLQDTAASFQDTTASSGHPLSSPPPSAGPFAGQWVQGGSTTPQQLPAAPPPSQPPLSWATAQPPTAPPPAVYPPTASNPTVLGPPRRPVSAARVANARETLTAVLAASTNLQLQQVREGGQSQQASLSNPWPPETLPESPVQGPGGVRGREKQWDAGNGMQGGGGQWGAGSVMQSGGGQRGADMGARTGHDRAAPHLPEPQLPRPDQSQVHSFGHMTLAHGMGWGSPSSSSAPLVLGNPEGLEAYDDCLMDVLQDVEGDLGESDGDQRLHGRTANRAGAGSSRGSGGGQGSSWLGRGVAPSRQQQGGGRRVRLDAHSLALEAALRAVHLSQRVDQDSYGHAASQARHKAGGGPGAGGSVRAVRGGGGGARQGSDTGEDDLVLAILREDHEGSSNHASWQH